MAAVFGSDLSYPVLPKSEWCAPFSCCLSSSLLVSSSEELPPCSRVTSSTGLARRIRLACFRSRLFRSSSASAAFFAASSLSSGTRPASFSIISFLTCVSSRQSIHERTATTAFDLQHHAIQPQSQSSETEGSRSYPCPSVHVGQTCRQFLCLQTAGRTQASAMHHRQNIPQRDPTEILINPTDLPAGGYSCYQRIDAGTRTSTLLPTTISNLATSCSSLACSSSSELVSKLSLLPRRGRGCAGS